LKQWWSKPLQIAKWKIKQWWSTSLQITKRKVKQWWSKPLQITKRKIKQRLSRVPIISTKRTITSQLHPLNAKNNHNTWCCKSRCWFGSALKLWGLNRLRRSHPPLLMIRAPTTIHIYY
jgi:hypothetical protein